jgi:hypothetical protein
MSQSVVSLASFKGNDTIILLREFHISVSWLIISISILVLCRESEAFCVHRHNYATHDIQNEHSNFC